MEKYMVDFYEAAHLSRRFIDRKTGRSREVQYQNDEVCGKLRTVEIEAESEQRIPFALTEAGHTIYKIRRYKLIEKKRR